VRPCVAQRGEVLRHRVMSADGRDVAVVTSVAPRDYVTGVYPVQNGYLVMVCQPLFEIRNASGDTAREQHAQLVGALAEVGVRVVRARRQRDALNQAEHGAIAARETTSATA
jgi:hypothetical protein